MTGNSQKISRSTLNKDKAIASLGTIELIYI